VERVVDGVDKGNIGIKNIRLGKYTKEDFQKVFDRSCKLRAVAEDAENDYKKLIDLVNKKWDNF
jgi:hypothetical protein